MIFSRSADVILEDESLRDGLQLETALLPLESKLHLFQMMREAGLKRIQVGSFVHPTLVPQMAETDQLVEMIGHIPDMIITGLVLNDRGLDRALRCGLQHITMSTSISNSHSLKNFRKSKAEALESLLQMIRKCVDCNITARAGIQCAFGCADEGKINNEIVLEAIELALEAGASEINLADTAGMATPFQIKQLISQIDVLFPDAVISLHLHDSRGLAMANLVAGYEAGVRIFDTCIGGLGGCPFVSGAAGNIATEDAVSLFQASDIATGIDLDALCRVNHAYQELLGKELPGRICRLHQVCQRSGEK